MVLHFIDNSVGKEGRFVFDYLQSLLRELSSIEGVSVLAPANLSFPTDASSLHVSRYHSSCFRAIKNMRLLVRTLRDVRPAIVHIHGCGCWLSSFLMNQCERLDIPVIISTSKCFEPWNMYRGYLLCRFPRFLCFQRHLLRHACALHALSRQEQSTLSRLSWHPRLSARKPLNANVAVIPSFNRVNGMTVADMAERLCALYSKVADSNPFMLMTAEDKHCEDIMLTAGLASASSNVSIPGDECRSLASITEPSMRRILLHAADEGVYKYVVESALRFKIRLPALNVNGLSRFNSKYRPFSTNNEETNSSSIGEIIDSDETLTTAERDICKAIIDTWRKCQDETIRRVDFAVLYRLVRYTDYNEVLLFHALRRLRFVRRAARLLCILGERFFLSEGFMFTSPLDDKLTRRMRRRLQRLGVQ